jgi:hypothetical protein
MNVLGPEGAISHTFDFLSKHANGLEWFERLRLVGLESTEVYFVKNREKDFFFEPNSWRR